MQSNKENEATAANESTGPKMKKMTHKEHILAKSGMYIGSCKVDGDEPYWVCNTSGSSGDDDESMSSDESDEAATGVRMEYRKVRITPGLYKLFDEILVNAADNKQRDTPKHVMNKLEVTIESNCVTVRNNGSGISVLKHEEYTDIHIPELIFGHLLTSSNYDENVKQTVGGTNGLGAKLVNIYSKEFVVEIDDAVAQQRYRQVWRNNMSDKEKVKLTKYTGSTNSTSITFYPDFARFGMGDTNCFNQDMIDLFTKRVYDIAGTTHKSLKVYLNKKLVPVTTFKEYMGLYLGSTRPSVLDQVHPRWQLGVSLNETGTFAQVSFVNSIATARGGKHVDYMEDLVSEALLEQIKKKNKSLKDAKPAEVKKHLFLFVNSLIFNPTFDSQTKTYCTSSKADMQLTVDSLTKKESKEKVVLPESFVKSLTKSGIVAMLTEKLTERNTKSMSKTDGKKLQKRLTGIPKLEDANKAGTKDGHMCTLILTEGDSAKALAVSGLSVVGRDHYGVFPLKGKLLNVREASHKQIMENGEVTAIKQILGLKANTKYTDARDLRYGHVMIMADQDHDGSHIKGLLFAHFWPSLLQLPGFLQEFITPIVKVSKGVSASGVMSRGAQERRFYTLPEYDAWREAIGDEKSWTTKYYKGLGTSTAVEAKNYFSDLAKHQLKFAYEGAEDDEAIDMAFSRAKADARKDWLGGFIPGTFLSQEAGKLIPYAEFVHKELILFSVASNQRAIPSVIDGFKPGQRKILFSAFKRNLKKEIKVAQLAGYVSENSAYHHGEQSLCSTIVGMAQNFVGSNNINLLLPNGQFGTRLQGGKDAASARYIFTTLSPVARAVFPQADDGLLNYLTDDGQSIEPDFYVPILPMVLVNGSAGIGTGWSSNVPNFDPRSIVANLRKMISIHDEVDGDAAAMEIPFISQLPELHPHYKGFIGQVKHQGASSYIVKGLIEKLPDGGIHITELPLQKWTGDYKAHLETMLTAGEIKEFREYHTDSRVSFVVDLTPEQLVAYETGGMTLYKKFKLNSSLTSSNMVLFDQHGKLKRYNSANDILIDFFHVRMSYYESRKKMLVAAARAEERKLNDKVRFIREVNSGTIVIKEGKAKILAALVRGKYQPIPKKSKAKSNDDDEDASDEEVVESKSAAGEPRASDYDYLLSMPIWSLTKERADQLQRESESKAAEVRALTATTPSQMWLTDLTTFEIALDDAERNERMQEEAAAERSLERRLAGVKSDAARRKLRAELERPVPAGVVVQDYSDDFDEEKPAKEKKPRKNAAAASATSAISLLDDDEDDDTVVVSKEKKPAAKKSGAASKAKSVTAAAPKKAAAPRKKKAASDDDESMSDASDSEFDDDLPVAPRARTGRAAAAKKTSYVESDDDEEDVEEEEEEDDDADADASVVAASDEDDPLDESEYEMTPVKPKKSRPAASRAGPAAPAAAPKAKAKAASKAKSSPVKAPAEAISVPSPEPAPKKKAAAKKTAAAKSIAAAPAPVAPAPKPAESTVGLSLDDRLAARFASVGLAGPAVSTSVSSIMSTPPKKKSRAAASKREKEPRVTDVMASPSTATPDPKRRRLYNAAQSKQALDLAAATPAAKNNAKSKQKKGARAAAVDEEDEEDEAEVVAATKKTTKSAQPTSTRPQRAAKPTKSYAEQDDDDDEEEEDDMSVEEISDEDYDD